MEPSAGQADDARTAAIREFDEARRSGQTERLAAAALRLPATQAFGAHPGQLPALLHDAYATAVEPAVRCRLAAALARAWVYGGEARRATRFATEAVELATALGDPAAEADALDAALLSRWGPDDFVERVQLAARLDDVSAHLSAVEPKLSAHLWRLTTAWECLDVIAVQRQLRALDVLASEAGSARAAFFATSRRAMSCLVVGELAEADRLIARAQDSGTEAAEPDLPAVGHSLAASRARCVGDVPTLLAEAESFEAYGSEQGIASVMAEAAVLWLEAGRPDRALALVRRLSGTGLAELDRDVDFLLTVSCVVEVAANLDVRDLAADGARLLAPYAGRAVLNAGAVTFHGVTDDYLFRAVHLLDPPRAQRWQHSAASCYQRIGAPWWFERVQPTAVPTMGRAAGVTVHLHRDVDGHWTVGRDGATTTMPDLKGLHYLHHLLSHPGSALDAANLSAAVNGHPGLIVAPASHGHVLDAQALAAYRRRLADIDDALAEAESWADEGRRELLRSERDFLLDELRVATGLGGRRRRFSSADERARIAVRKAIVAAVDRIERQDPALARVLRDSVHTGTSCQYDPDPGRRITWLLEGTGAAMRAVGPRIAPPTSRDDGNAAGGR